MSREKIPPPSWSRATVRAAFSPGCTWGCCVAETQSADVMESGFRGPAFPLGERVRSEWPGAVQGAPVCAAERTLDGEDHSEIAQQEGKPDERRRQSKSKTVSKPIQIRGTRLTM